MGLRGFLTRGDVEALEEASKRQYKYPKKHVKKFECAECNYSWFYKSNRCPVCAADIDVSK